MGLRAVGLKPVASGAVHTPAGLRNDDALALAAASGQDLPYELTNPHCFEPAIAPHLAAAEAGRPILVEQLIDWYRTASAAADLAIVEGAGGWRVPLYPHGFISDFPEAVGLPVILVVGLRLGCLNHARLTLEAIERSGRCGFLGWVGSEIDPGFPRIEENVASLTDLLGGPPLGRLPTLNPADAAGAARYLGGERLQRLLRQLPARP
jgi:dethiobiotin synthetase